MVPSLALQGVADSDPERLRAMCLKHSRHQVNIGLGRDELRTSDLPRTRAARSRKGLR